MTSQEMFKTTSKPGHIWQNVAAVDNPQDWVQVPRPADFNAAGNPNSPIYEPKLFGYGVNEFMAKQYR